MLIEIFSTFIGFSVRYFPLFCNNTFSYFTIYSSVLWLIFSSLFQSDNSLIIFSLLWLATSHFPFTLNPLFHFWGGCMNKNGPASRIKQLWIRHLHYFILRSHWKMENGNCWLLLVIGWKRESCFNLPPKAKSTDLLFSISRPKIVKVCGEIY